ncbi:MAG: NADP-specific glutamate dehydrogenase [Acholeplasma sp.]|nr:NADP-specific glutamate dehydrogenase [Acholeplasma sp.]
MFKSPYLQRVFEDVMKKDPFQPEFIQAVETFFLSMDELIVHTPTIEKHAIMERLIEPERLIKFKVTWVDDKGNTRVNRGYRVQFNSLLGPFKGGLRFHPTVNESTMKFLGFEQTFKNALTGLPLGGGKGGSDFNPTGKSDGEIMRFCQNFMLELSKHIGPDTDVPAGDIGVGNREIGYLYGMYKKIKNESNGVLTGKGLSYGGSLVRKEATGYGLCYFVCEMLKTYRGERIDGKKVIISGSGKVGFHAAMKVHDLGGIVCGMSDVKGFIYNPDGLNMESVSELCSNGDLTTKYKDRHDCLYGPNPKELWQQPCELALPCAIQNELDLEDAKALVKNGCYLVAEGANMPCTLDAEDYFSQNQILFAPGKAANAGGVAVSLFEMSQNASHYPWSYDEVDDKLKGIMRDIFLKAYTAARKYKNPYDLISGANIASFFRIYEAMIEEGIV